MYRDGDDLKGGAPDYVEEASGHRANDRVRAGALLPGEASGGWPRSAPKPTQGHPLTGKQVFGERCPLGESWPLREGEREGGRWACAEFIELRQRRAEPDSELLTHFLEPSP